MNYVKQILLCGLVVAALSGCVNVNIPLGGSAELQEVLLEDSEGWFHHDKILVVDVGGVISEEIGGGLLGGELTCTPAYIKAVLRKAAQDDKVKAVVLRVDSPGGTVSASELIAREIVKFREDTGVPVIAQITGMGCSGAYYLAAGCDAINIQPSGITGSIGVIGIFPKYRKLADKVGFEEVVFKSGAMKDIGSGMRDMTDEERQVMQGTIDADYENFLAWISTNRPQTGTHAALKKLADGRIYTAQQALDHKLVDDVCFLDDSIYGAMSAVGLVGKDGEPHAKVITYSYNDTADANIYSPAMRGTPLRLTSGSLPGPLGARSPGFYFLWKPGE